MKLLAEVAQLVEHGTENAGVDSSILSLGTIHLKFILILANSLFQIPSDPSDADILPTLASI